MKKKLLSIILLLIVTSLMVTPIFAALNWDATQKCNISLSFSGTTAHCTLDVYATDSDADITATIKLQKKGLLRWNDESSNYNYSIHSNTAELGNLYTVGSGTYRLKVVFTVYSGSASETITAYSDTLKI